MSFELNARSRENLKHVHPDLVRVVERAAQISNRAFTVIDGARTVAEQRENVAKGFSKTMNSRHVIAANGYAHAVDIVIIEGKTPLWSAHREIERPMKQAARELGIPIEWGGDWKGGWDTPHYQLPWKQYPAAGAVNLAKSRQVKGAGLALGGGAFSLLDQVSEVADKVNDANAHISSGKILGIIIAAVIIGGAAYVLYARWCDAGRPLPWGRVDEDQAARNRMADDEEPADQDEPELPLVDEDKLEGRTE